MAGEGWTFYTGKYSQQFIYTHNVNRQKQSNLDLSYWFSHLLHLQSSYLLEELRNTGVNIYTVYQAVDTTAFT